MGKGEKGRDKGMKEGPSLSCSKAESSGHDKERDNEGRGGVDTGKSSNEGDGLTEEKEGNEREEDRQVKLCQREKRQQKERQEETRQRKKRQRNLGSSEVKR